MTAKKKNRASTARAAQRLAPASAVLIERTARPGLGGEPPITVTRAGLALVERTAAAGGSMKVVGAALGVSETSLRRLMARDEAVALAFARGSAVDEQRHVGLLRTAASKGNVVASIFWLKVRHGFREQESPTPIQNLQIVQLPAPMSPEAYAKHIEQRTAQSMLPAPGPSTDVIDAEVVEPTAPAVQVGRATR